MTRLPRPMSGAGPAAPGKSLALSRFRQHRVGSVAPTVSLRLRGSDLTRRGPVDSDSETAQAQAGRG